MTRRNFRDVCMALLFAGLLAACSSFPEPSAAPDDAASRFSVSETTSRQHPELVRLIANSESMNDDEKQYWFDLLPKMKPHQIARLRAILNTEKEQLEALEKNTLQKSKSCRKSGSAERSRLQTNLRRNPVMGIICVDLRLGNDARDDLEELNISALVDAGALQLCVPGHVALQLSLKERGVREVTLVDGKRRQVSYVSPVRVELLGRRCVTGALVLGDRVILGAIPMEDMDLVVQPALMRVSVNPEAPNLPMSLAKRA